MKSNTRLYLYVCERELLREIRSIKDEEEKEKKRSAGDIVYVNMSEHIKVKRNP